MHLFAQRILDQTDFRGAHITGNDLAGDGGIGGDCSRLGKGSQRQKPPVTGDDGVAVALVLAHDKRLQKPVRGDGCGKFVQGFALAGLADIALPRDKFVQGYGCRVSRCSVSHR
jgi:hypothetical protein